MKRATMAATPIPLNRRGFLKASLMSGLATTGTVCWAAPAASVVERPALPPSRVALTAGQDGADNVFRGLKTFQSEISRAIGERRVVIKPNNVAIDIPLCATPAGCLEGILEFLKSIGKLQDAVIEIGRASCRERV